MLKEIDALVNELNETNSSTEKIKILKKLSSPIVDKILFYTYNSFYQFGVTSANLKKNKDLVELTDKSLIEILDMLRVREITGHKAIGIVNGYVKKNEEFKDLIYRIIDKDLKIRVDAKSINKAIKDLIPTFNVALAEKYDPNRVDFNELWYASRKIDGVRCIVIKDMEGNVSSWSRQGKKFETLSVLEDEIRKLPNTGIVLDGEMCLINDSGLEDFQGIMKEIRKKDHTIKNPRYLIFDYLSLDDFNRSSSKSLLSERLIAAKKSIPSSSILKVLNQVPVKSEEQIVELLKVSREKNYEGWILRKDTTYEGKRSHNLLKLKDMKDSEYRVVSIVSGAFRVIDETTGLEVEVEMLARVNIEHKGNLVGVGSGFSIEQRKEFFSNPEKIIGKVITVQYFEETKNKDGSYSLRFPVFKILHGDKRVV